MKLDDILKSQKDLFETAFEGFSAVDVEKLDELEAAEDIQLFAVSQDESKKAAHEGLVACIKAYASWFFNVLKNVFTCNWKEIPARPACCWTKLDVTSVEFQIAHAVAGEGEEGEEVKLYEPLDVKMITTAALKALGVEDPEEVPEAKEEEGDKKAKKADKKEKKEEVKSPLDTNIEALTKAAAKDKKSPICLDDVRVARFNFKVVDGKKEASISFVKEGQGFDDKKAKVFTYTFKA